VYTALKMERRGREGFKYYEGKNGRERPETIGRGGRW
jgi:hypothetical protein